MQRWNDKIRPADLNELDKQAHKMMIAYIIGKFEEGRADFDWTKVIEGGIFEFLHRLVITDIKPQVFELIKQEPDELESLNKWVYERLAEAFSSLPDEFERRFKAHFASRTRNINRKVLDAAHIYATKWEFDLIEPVNCNDYEIDQMRAKMQERLESCYDLEGARRLILYPKLYKLVALCGQLRFQYRWEQVYRIPRTSVLGHSLIVAVISYLCSFEIGSCKKRRFNDFFTGLFHDLPEALTRDIVSPVKKSVEGLDALIKRYEKQQMEKNVYGLIPESWIPDMKLFTEEEFMDTISKNGKRIRIQADQIEKFNHDEFSPRDGSLVKAVDNLAAFAEAYIAIQNGIQSSELTSAINRLKGQYSNLRIAGLNFGGIYSDF